jgi:hypothetical protein
MVWRDFGQPRADKHSRRARLKAMALAGYFAARHSYVFNLGERAAKSAIRRQWRGRLPIELADGSRLELFPADFRSKTAGARAGRTGHIYHLSVESSSIRAPRCGKRSTSSASHRWTWARHFARKRGRAPDCSSRWTATPMPRDTR